MVFNSVVCTGEFTLTMFNAFDPMWHVKPSNMSNRTDQNDLEVTVFHLPKTKYAPEVEEVFWLCQDGVMDPKAALNNHLLTNNPPPNGLLFAYKHAKGLRPLTKKVFLDQINSIVPSLGEDSLKGHGIWIRGTLEFLLRGMPFDVMKLLGHWTSEVFMLYLCQHATIIVPYIQNHPVLEEFTHYTMPWVGNHW